MEAPKTLVRRRIRVQMNPDGSATPLPDTPEIRRFNILRQLRNLDTRPQIQAQRNEARAVQLVRQAVARPRVQRLVEQFVARRPQIIPIPVVGFDAELTISTIFRANRNRPFTVIVREGGRIIAEQRFNFTGISYTEARRMLRDFFIVYDTDEFNFAPGSRIFVYPFSRVTPVVRPQAYREGQEHCVFAPLIALWSQKPRAISTQKEHAQILKRVQKLADEYGDRPVPHDDLPALAKTTNTTIKIYDPLGHEIHAFNRGARKTLALRHTKSNHVEVTQEDREARDITYDEAQDILRSPQANGDLVIEGSYHDPYRLYTNTEILTVINPMKPYMDEIFQCLPDLAFNATKFPDVNAFLLASRIVNSATLAFNPEYDQHYDLEKAYTQFHTTSFYKGFLGVIHQWRQFTFPPTQEFLDSHIGIYKAIIHSPSPLARMLGMNPNDTLILPSPEWNFHKATGTTFTIVSGVWGQCFDFRFPDSALQTVKTRQGTSDTPPSKSSFAENKPFRLFAGQCSSKLNEHHARTFSFHATLPFAEHLATLYPRTDYNEFLGIATVSIPSTTVMTRHHLFSFLTSYTRIVMMEQMSKLPLKDISAVTLDGLYFKGSPSTPFSPCFRPKAPRNTTPTGTTPWYAPVHSTDRFPALTPYNENSALLGAGGTGKTQAILKDPGFNTALYVAPNHSLGRAKQQEFGLPYATLHRAIGEGCDSWKELHGTPPVIFVDELTQCEDSFIARLLALYPHSLIFIAGDIDETGRHFQCKYTNSIWKPTLPCITFTTDYRSQSEELKDIKVALRDFMRTDPTSDEVKDYAKEAFHHIPWATAVLDFKPESDVWIAGTHRTIKRFPFPVHTTHSYQGKTIEPPTRLFISTDDLFESTMFYTALSRVRHHDQLVFVSGAPFSPERIRQIRQSTPDHPILALYPLPPFRKSEGPEVLNDEADESCGLCTKWGPGFLYTNGTDEHHICKSCLPY